MRSDPSRTFGYHPPSAPHIVAAHERIRHDAETLARVLEGLLPECAEKDRALEALDLATMHANAAVAREQELGCSAAWITDDGVSRGWFNLGPTETAWDTLREQMADLDWDISQVGEVQEALAQILGLPEGWDVP